MAAKKTNKKPLLDSPWEDEVLADVEPAPETEPAPTQAKTKPYRLRVAVSGVGFAGQVVQLLDGEPATKFAEALTATRGI